MTEDEQISELVTLGRGMTADALEQLLVFARLWAKDCPKQLAEEDTDNLRLRLVRVSRV